MIEYTKYMKENNKELLYQLLAKSQSNSPTPEKSQVKNRITSSNIFNNYTSLRKNLEDSDELNPFFRSQNFNKNRSKSDINLKANLKSN